MYRDTESGGIVTAEQLKAEYTANAASIYNDSGAATFAEWLHNCTGLDGFLERV